MIAQSDVFDFPYAYGSFIFVSKGERLTRLRAAQQREKLALRSRHLAICALEVAGASEATTASKFS